MGVESHLEEGECLEILEHALDHCLGKNACLMHAIGVTFL